jgi:RNA polymerase sigma factor (sigma-70 family)
VSHEPFDAVVRRHGPTVLRVCRAVVGSQGAEDAWSETFLSALRAYPSLRPDSNVEAWLVTIAHRKALDQARADARRPVPSAELPQRPRPDEAAPDAHATLLCALAGLPLKQRQTVAYHYLADLPYAEVAEIVGGTAEASRRSAADGIARLRGTYRAWLRDQDAEGEST